MAFASAGCAATSPETRTSVAEPYTCRREQPPERVELPASMTGPTGKLRITCEPPAPIFPGETAPARPRMCHFLVQNATLAEVADALSEATGLGVVVSPSVGSFRESLVLPDATLPTFLSQLESRRWGITTRLESNLIRIGLASELDNQKDADPEAALLPAPAGTSPREVASAICNVLTRRGRVSVVGRNLVIVDADEGIARAEKLVQAFEQLQAPPRPASAEQPTAETR